jgi:hypothetical protein
VCPLFPTSLHFITTTAFTDVEELPLYINQSFHRVEKMKESPQSESGV